MYKQVLLSSLLLVGSVLARDVPTNIKSFYDSLKAQGDCKNKLATGFFAEDNGPDTFSYCGDHLADFNIIYIKGTGSAFADMDVDCDGVQHGTGDDGRCGSSSDTQSITAFQDTVAGFKKGIKDLNAFVHPYVVFGNQGSKKGFKTFDPTAHGVKPLSVMAVVCGDQLIYGIWGDTNGDDGAHSLVGEAAISTATACFGKSINGNSGHDQTDVLYIAFAGADAAPGADGAAWDASSFQEFEASITALGDKLIQRINGSGNGTSATPAAVGTAAAAASSTFATSTTAKTASARA